MTVQQQSRCRILTRWSRPGKISSCLKGVPGPRMSKRAKKTDPPECTSPGVKVPHFIQIARSKTNIEGKECRTFQQSIGDTSSFFAWSLARRAEPKKPRVFQVQRRSTFAGMWRHVREAVSCEWREDDLKKVNRLVLCKTSGE